ncbi:unnamed protein product [Spodoptera littoralis]|uniref:Uncharacterized protein n=1 Tax=Spodoptera littoralis TaxID=7109 RepID=A0A9P0NCA1_SPOLI|nr:unnamed protein product [Spodoptera littoralis]CAH1647669.1 unnamed protein product [Spodoptera littoralis]
MHEDAPKMSVAQSLPASTSQAKSEIVTDVPPVDYELNTVELKPSQTIEMELKLAYVNPSSGDLNLHTCAVLAKD